MREKNPEKIEKGKEELDNVKQKISPVCSACGGSGLTSTGCVQGVCGACGGTGKVKPKPRN